VQVSQEISPANCQSISLSLSLSLSGYALFAAALLHRLSEGKAVLEFEGVFTHPRGTIDGKKVLLLDDTKNILSVKHEAISSSDRNLLRVSLPLAVYLSLIVCLCTVTCTLTVPGMDGT
jgi:hypothetical protein